MRVAIYVRVSTFEQAKEGFSIPAQIERLRAFCKSQGWEIVEEYIEDGYSAKDLKRPHMNRMIKDLQRKKFDIVLVYRLDRLTRSVLDLYELLKLFDQHDVSFKSATEVYDTSTAMGRLFITLVAALAQWERENLGERVKFGIEQMIDEGKKPGGHSPYGYKFDKDFNCTIIEDEANIVRKIFQWYADGYGFRAISERLTSMGIKPRLAAIWNHNSVRDILLNDMYIGHYRWGGKIIENNHPPLIDELLYKKVHKVMKDKPNNSARKGKFALTGVISCGSCDHPMQGFYDKRDEKTYYRCIKCNRVTHDSKILEPLLNELEALFNSEEDFIKKVKEQTSQQELPDLSKIRSEVEKIRRQKEKWYDVYMDEENPIPKKDLFEKINNLNEQEKQLQIQLDEYDIIEPESIDQKILRYRQYSNIKSQYAKGTLIEQKDILHNVLEKLVLYRDKGKNQDITLKYYLK
jgi:site-specific DNA recombinase